MARIISFSWTTPALLAGEKTVTRRNWKDKHAARHGEGQVLQAWDKSPRFGGKRIGTIRLTHNPVKENTLDAPSLDYGAEGFGYLEHIGARLMGKTPTELWEQWKTPPGVELWVVRFELIEVL